jgi:hypothetical protein
MRSANPRLLIDEPEPGGKASALKACIGTATAFGAIFVAPDFSFLACVTSYNRELHLKGHKYNRVKKASSKEP